ncbi:MAG: hypothetical protein M0000_06365 [Actinomycetota bacterium]|nr:hypothetical protein [Actinomycetota bacterium]
MTWTADDKALLRTACAEGARWALTLPDAEAVIRSTEHPDWSAWLIRRWVESGRPLPKGLTVGGWLDLSGCTALTALPDGLEVGGSLNLSGCTGLGVDRVFSSAAKARAALKLAKEA